MSSSLAYTRSGSGAPLVLLHGIGLNRSSWNQVVPTLAQHFAAMGTCPGFEATLAATARQGYRATAPITAPVKLAFGSRDVLLLRGQSRHLDQLPPGIQAETLPRCGHVPMADDPGAVAELITRTAARAAQAPVVR